MRLYTFDGNKINGIAYPPNTLGLGITGNTISLYYLSNFSLCLTANLEDIEDSNGDPFTTIADFITYWNSAFIDTSSNIIAELPKDTIDQFVLTSLVDTTNVTAGTNYYSAAGGISMDGYSSLSLTGKLITTGTITMTVEVTNDEDTANADWVQSYFYDLKSDGFVNSLTVTNTTLTFAILMNGLNCRLVRIKIVDSASTNTYIVKSRRVF
mgnify:CR=1 FL=1